MIICGDALTELKKLESGIVQTAITSPPYWGLRDYGIDGHLGLEVTPEKYVSCLVEIFAETRRVLRDDGTLWLNIGDSYRQSGGFGHRVDEQSTMIDKGGRYRQDNIRLDIKRDLTSLKPKDLCMIPARVALALQADGWYLRSDIIWHKPNCMPESATDRPTSAHEHIFLLAKNQRYFYDADAVREETDGEGYRNKRNVWTVATQPYPEAHFATFPPALIEPCVLAGSREGDMVLDPFLGSGTTALVALKHRREFIGIELNPEYVKLAEKRLREVEVVMF